MGYTFDSHRPVQIQIVRSEDILLLRKFDAPILYSGYDTAFERDLMTEPFETLDVVTGQALRSSRKKAHRSVRCSLRLSPEGIHDADAVNLLSVLHILRE